MPSSALAWSLLLVHSDKSLQSTSIVKITNRPACHSTLSCVFLLLHFKSCLHSSLPRDCLPRQDHCFDWVGAQGNIWPHRLVISGGNFRSALRFQSPPGVNSDFFFSEWCFRSQPLVHYNLTASVLLKDALFQCLGLRDQFLQDLVRPHLHRSWVRAAVLQLLTWVWGLAVAITHIAGVGEVL